LVAAAVVALERLAQMERLLQAARAEPAHLVLFLVALLSIPVVAVAVLIPRLAVLWGVMVVAVLEVAQVRQQQVLPIQAAVAVGVGKVTPVRQVAQAS
jgi:hypothetical protein